MVELYLLANIGQLLTHIRTTLPIRPYFDIITFGNDNNVKKNVALKVGKFMKFMNAPFKNKRDRLINIILTLFYDRYRENTKPSVKIAPSQARAPFRPRA